jgi:hypothetical protein
MMALTTAGVTPNVAWSASLDASASVIGAGAGAVAEGGGALAEGLPVELPPPPPPQPASVSVSNSASASRLFERSTPGGVVGWGEIASDKLQRTRDEEERGCMTTPVAEGRFDARVED